MKLMAKYYKIDDAKIGEDTIVRDFVNLYGCKIGNGCRIAAYVEIQRGVTIGDRCKIEAFAFIPSGVTIEDEVFIGPHACFTNDRVPKAVGDWEVTPTLVKKGASIGANATIVCGVTIGENALVGAGAVVTKDVPAGAIVVGCPAKRISSREDRQEDQEEEGQMKVPIAQPVMTEKMIEAAANALRNERLTLGESVYKFEEAFARMCGTKHAIALSSGTAALQLALQAADVKCGDKVLTSAMSFVATSNSFVAFGGEPVFTDVDYGDFNLDPAKLKLDKGTKAIIPVHLYGYPARMDEINEVAAKHGAVVVEDACQAHGAKYKGKRAGALGLMGCFSFYPTKNMHVGGDGGMVTTNDQKLADLVKRLRHCGRKGQYEHDLIGTTARLNSANAAVGIEQLKMLPQWNEKRRAVAAKYDSMLKGVGDLSAAAEALEGLRARVPPVRHPDQEEERAQGAPRVEGRRRGRALRHPDTPAAGLQGHVRLQGGHAAHHREALQGGPDAPDVRGHHGRAGQVRRREHQGILRVR